MRRTYPGLIKVILILVFSGLLAAMAACKAAPAATTPAAQPTAPAATTPATPTPAAPAYTINISNKAGIGDYLVDSKGMTMYYFLRDNYFKSNATAAIVANWPVFYTASIVVPASLKASDFGFFTRDDGQKQTTYKGWPLYYYVKDQAPGDTTGQQFNSIWFVITPVDFMSAPAAPLPAPQPGSSGPPQQYTY